VFFDMSYFGSAERCVGTIRLRGCPMSLGSLTDVEGQRWDIGAIVGDASGTGFVCACRMEGLHPFYYDGSLMILGADWKECLWERCKRVKIGEWRVDEKCRRCARNGVARLDSQRQAMDVVELIQKQIRSEISV